MESQLNIEEIEAYLKGTLQGESLRQFKKQLQEDQQLAARVRLMQNLDTTLADSKALKVQKTVQEVGANFFTARPSSQSTNKLRPLPFFRRPMAIAASLLVLLALTSILWWQLNKGPVSHQELFATYYTPYEADGNRGDAAEAIITSYEMGHTFLQQDPPNLERASVEFRNIVLEGKSILVPKAQWYLALTYLQQGHLKETKTLLNALLNSEDINLAKQAKELLEDLD